MRVAGPFEAMSSGELLSDGKTRGLRNLGTDHRFQWLVPKAARCHASTVVDGIFLVRADDPESPVAVTQGNRNNLPHHRMLGDFVSSG